MISSRAPGKAVVLGEYAVLDGAPALVAAVDRRASVTIAPAADDFCELVTLAPEPVIHRARPGEPLGVPLADLAIGADAVRPFRAQIDSRAFFHDGCKLGLGSSAAVLCAWAAAWLAHTRPAVRPAIRPDLNELISWHRAFQGGAGSGLDVAASLTGGLIEYRLDVSGLPRIGSVGLPNSVGFAGIFAGSSASTPDLVGRFRAWQAGSPRLAAEQHRRWGDIAEAGCVAARENDGQGFLDAVRQYGQCLAELGDAIGADIVTVGHRRIGVEASRFGVVYKVSGAGGGDLGLAFSDDPQALAAFRAAVLVQGFVAVDLSLDKQGLIVEERAG
jgi:phosphomevalonate kinase